MSDDTNLPGDDEPMADVDLGPLDALLRDPLVWEEPDPDLGDAVLAAIQAEMQTVGRPLDQAPPAQTPFGVEEVPGENRVWTVQQVSPTGESSALYAGQSLDDDQDAPQGHSGHQGQNQDHGSAVESEATVVSLDSRRRRWVAPLVSAAATLLIVVGAGLGWRILSAEETREPDYLVALGGTDLAPDASAEAAVSNTALGTVLILDVRGLEPAPEGQYYEAWLRQSPEVGVSAGTFHLRGGDGSIELWAGVTPEDYPLITVTLQEEGGGAASSGQVVLAGRVEDLIDDGADG